MLFSCKEVPDYHRMHESNKLFFYSKKFHAIYINHCDIVDLPDSIISKKAFHLMIKCSKLSDYNILLKQINPKEIISIRIDDLSNPSTTLDLTGFENLRRVMIFGNEKVKEIKLKKSGNNLKHLYLGAPFLDFPKFDSSFLNLVTLHYEGNAESVPSWVEKLDNLKNLRFTSANLSKVLLDVCKMEKLEIFDIIGNKVEDKETHLKKSKFYPTLLKFKECKPDLKLIYRLPDY